MAAALRSAARQVASQNRNILDKPTGKENSNIPSLTDEEDDDNDDVMDKITMKDLKATKGFKPAQADYLGQTMVDGANEVGSRLKERELNTITITSISVSKLPLINKFNRNDPWLKITYGTYTWSTPISNITDERGTAAEWDELSYQMVLPSEESQRSDLTISVCSQKVVLGRYILQAKNFSKIPNVEESEYFEVKGKITNSLGKAGRIVMICRHGKATQESPQKPVKALDQSPTKVIYAPKQNDKFSSSDIDKVYVKLLSVILVDMPRVTKNYLNSPVVSVSCGPWEKKTNVEYDAGQTAKWTRLHWKLILGQLDILSFTVNSEPSETAVSTFLGTVGVSIDDLTPDKVGTDGMVIVVRYLTNGRDITGKIRIRLQVRYPTAFVSKLSSTANNAAALQKRNSLLLAEANKRPGSAGPVVTPQDQLTAADIRKDGRDQSGRITVTEFPFKLTILSITAVDLKPRHTLFPNSPYVNLVHGSWGQGTDIVNGAGACASWTNLNWQVVITDEHHLEIQAWSRGYAIGGISLSPQYLMRQPINKDGNTTLLLKLTDENKVTSGKLKIACNYHPDTSGLAVVTDLQRQRAIDDMVNLGLFFTKNTTSVELPATAAVVSISVIDLASVHVARANSPQVRLICDRQMAATTVAVKGGSQATWLGVVNWTFDIFQGSFVVLAVTSEDKLIGSVELSSKMIVSVPPNESNIVELSTTILSSSGLISGRVKLCLKLTPISGAALPRGLSARIPVSPHADPNNFEANETHSSVASLVLNKLFMLIEITKIEINDLKSKLQIFNPGAGGRSGNGVWISLVYGKYHESTVDSEAIQSELPSGKKTGKLSSSWNDLNWRFKIKEDYSLRLVLHSKEGALLGLLSISPQTLFTCESSFSHEKSYLLSEVFYNENIATAKVAITFKKTVCRDWNNDFKPLEHGPNALRAANRASVIGTLSKFHNEDDNEGQLPPIFESDGVRPFEENDEEPGEEAKSEDKEFPMIASISSITLDSFNFDYLRTLISLSKKPPLPNAQPSIASWLSRNLLGIATVHPVTRYGRSASNVDLIPLQEDEKITRLPNLSRISVRFDVFNQQTTRGNKWTYETQEVVCKEDGESFVLTEDVKLPLLSMFTEVVITVSLLIQAPSNSTGKVNKDGTTTYVLGTSSIVAEDFADVPGNPTTKEISISRSISRGRSATVKLSIASTLEATTLQNIYQQYFPYQRTEGLPIIRNLGLETIQENQTLKPSFDNSNFDDEDPFNQPFSATSNSWMPSNVPLSNSISLPIEPALTDPIVEPDIENSQSLAQPGGLAIQSVQSSLPGTLRATLSQDFSALPTINESPSNVLSPHNANNNLVGGVGVAKQPFKFDIATDEDAIGKLFVNHAKHPRKSSNASANSDSQQQLTNQPKVAPNKDVLKYKVLSVRDFEDDSKAAVNINRNTTYLADEPVDDGLNKSVAWDGAFHNPQITPLDLMSPGSTLVSIANYEENHPDVNYAEQARRQRFADLIAGTDIREEDEESVVMDSEGNYSHEFGNTDDEEKSPVTNKNTSLLQQQLFSHQMKEDTGLLFEKIKLSGYNVQIKNITAIDLNTAHRFKTNSPAIAITCGELTYNTAILHETGPVGSWTGLDLSVIIYRDNDMTLTVSSRGKVIGSTTLTLKRLLKAATSHGDHHAQSQSKGDFDSFEHDLHEIKFHNNQSDLLTVFSDLIPEEKGRSGTAGKIKMSFKLSRL